MHETYVSTRSQANLARREAEIALRMRRIPEEGALTTRRIGRIAFALYVARKLLDTRGPEAAWRHGVIGLPETDRTPSQSRWLDDTARERKAMIRIRLSEVTLRHRAAQQGVGVTLLPCFLGDSDPALARLLDPSEALTEDIYVLVHKDLRPIPAVEATMAALATLFRRARSELVGEVPYDVSASP